MNKIKYPGLLGTILFLLFAMPLQFIIPNEVNKIFIGVFNVYKRIIYTKETLNIRLFTIKNSSNILLSILVIDFIIISSLSIINKLNWKKQIKQLEFNFNIKIIFILSLLGLCLSLFLNELITLIVLKFNISIFEYTKFNFLLKNISGLISIIILAPILEEIIFRYFLINSYRNKINNLSSILISAFIFSIFHLNYLQIIPTFIIGIVLGITYIYTGKLLYSIYLHFIYNLFSIFLALIFIKINPNNIVEFKIYDFVIFLFSFIIAIILIISLILKGKRILDKNSKK